MATSSTASNAAIHSAQPSALRVWSALLIVYIVWGSTYIGIALSVETLPPLIGSGIRFVIAAAAMAAIIAVWQGPRTLRVTRRGFASSALIGVMLLATGIGTFSMVADQVPTSTAALIIATISLWVVLIRWVTGDRPRPLTLIGVGVGLLGLAVILAPGGFAPPASGPAATSTSIVVGSLALVGSSFLWAWGSWLSPKLPTPANTIVFTTYQMLVAGVVLLLAGLIIGERLDVSAVSTASWIGLAYLIIFGSLIAYTAFTWLIGNTPLSLVSTYAYVNPAVAVVLGVIIFGEAISSDIVFGVVFVLGGVALVVSSERIRRQPLGD